MGALFSIPQPTEEEKKRMEEIIARSKAHPALPRVPPEADESGPEYASFLEQVRVVPHKDGTCLVAYAGKEVRCVGWWEPNPFDLRGVEVHEYILKAVGVENPMETGGQVHPRIVKYLGQLTPGYKLELFHKPGPLQSLVLPALSVPISDDATGSKLPPVLLLYYRWALQTLSALQFLHSQSVYLRDFSHESIWIRADFSAAIASFIQATFPGAEPMGGEDFPRGNGGGIEFCEAEPEYDEEGFQAYGTPRSDICDWANVVWELMTNRHSVAPPQLPRGHDSAVWPEDPQTWPAKWDYKDEEKRIKEKKFCQLEEARLGPVLVKAWSGDYRNVSQVIQDVRAVIEKKGVEVIGEDEILPGDSMSWGDIFTIVPPSDERPYCTEIRIREKRGLDSASRVTLLPEVKHE
ncbi:hypothetical protein BJX65DRAFT_310736 [Aspergillus insuetus]